MTNTFSSLLDLVYPTGSVYLCTNSTKPSTAFGGTWGQKNGAVLAATGANGFASANATGGSLQISVNQMPNHSHPLKMRIDPTGFGRYGIAGCTNSGQEYITDMVQAIGGGKTSCRIIIPSTVGHVLRKNY